MTKILTVIPARYASTRFPGKPLVDINGKPMIWQVYERALEAGLENVIVATDDDRIFEAVISRGGKAMMTSPDHISGTDRCAEVLHKLNAQGQSFDFLLNLQGDEPFIAKEQINLLCRGLEKNKICTLAKKIDSNYQLVNPNTVKIVWSSITQEALYFSRLPIPYLRAESEPLERHQYFKHIGIYGFDTKILNELIGLKPSSLEIAESLEQLRWMENGYRIKIIETTLESKGIDTPEDLIGI